MEGHEVIVLGVAGHSGTMSNFLRPALVPRLQELLKKSEEVLD